ncbi:MAG: hypothetical protein AAFO69_16340, partial [Bacteroidota bacterium]
MRPVNIQLFILLAFISLSCATAEDTPDKRLQQTDQIVLIFDKKPDLGEREISQIVVLKNNTVITYLDDNNKSIRFSPDHQFQNDTIVIKTQKKQLDVLHLYYEFEGKFNYRFTNGDTVHFTYIHDLPKAVILNRQFNDQELNYNFYEASRFNDLLYRNKLLKRMRFDNLNYQRHWGDFQQLIASKKHYLDSLKSRGAVSNEVFVRQYLIYAKEYREIAKYFADYIPGSSITEFGYGLDLFIDFPPFQIDSLLQYDVYRQLAWNHATDELINGQKVTGEHFRIADYRQSYDSVVTSPLYSEATKNYLLPQLLDRIAEDFPNDFEKYLSKIRHDIKDTTIVEKITYSFLKDLDELKAETARVHLLSRSGELTTLKKEIDNHKGKVVYVDLW